MKAKLALDEGTQKSQPLPEGTTTDPKDSRRNVQPTDKGLPSTVSNEGTVKTTSLPEEPLGDKGSEGSKRSVDMKPINSTVADLSGTGEISSEVEPDIQTLQLNTFAYIQAFLLSKDELAQESDDDVLEAGEDMDEDTQDDEEEHQSPSNTDKPEQSLAQEYQESDSDSSSPELKKYDNILPLTCNTPKMGHSENMSGSVTS
ncbi:hypothetical protein Tco_0379598 [Tanacetum coccineum]